jgi:glycosyltransferase involved in cell wall biosynthesis
MRITYYVHDLHFPVVEGVRKQAWWMAQEMQRLGHSVTILSTGHKKKKIIKDGVKIIYGNPFQIALAAKKTEIMHYISHPSPLLLPLLLMVKAKKHIMTLFDGNLNGFWKREWDVLLSNVVRKKVTLITIQTEYQKRVLQKTRIKEIPRKVILPLIPHFKRTHKRSKNPTLLFMSHLSSFKGIDEVLRAFKTIKQEIPHLKLVICNSGINKNNKKIQNTDIILKGKVNPEEELSKAWVYLYPIQKTQETFSIPLSLIEAAQVKTQFIGTNVGGIAEYFPPSNLIPPKNHILLAQKIKHCITHKNKTPQISKINNKDTLQQWQKIYQN